MLDNQAMQLLMKPCSLSASATRPHTQLAKTYNAKNGHSSLECAPSSDVFSAVFIRLPRVAVSDATSEVRMAALTAFGGLRELQLLTEGSGCEEAHSLRLLLLLAAAGGAMWPLSVFWAAATWVALAMSSACSSVKLPSLQCRNCTVYQSPLTGFFVINL